MANKLNISFKDGCENLWQALGIQQKRADELEYRFALIIHDVTKPRRVDDEGPDSGQFVKLCASLAENEQELVFCSYMAGMKVAELFETEDEEIYSDDEEGE